MPAKSIARGHVIFFNQEWVYADTGESVEGNDRSCARCGNLPDEKGHDFCLGDISGVSSACCGHGVEDGFFLFE